MKLIESRDHVLVIRDRPGLFKSCFMLIWSSFFVGIPSLLMMSTIAGAGPTRLDCTWLEPQQLACEISKAKFLGLGPRIKRLYTHVTEAQFNQTEGIDSDGDDTQDYWVSLATSTGTVTLFEDPIRYNGTRGSKTEMVALSDQINRYIQGGEMSFRVERDLSTSLSQMLFPILFASVFLVIGLGVLYWTFQIKLTRFDQTCDRLFWKHISLLGVKNITLPLDDIRAVVIEEQENDDGPSSYLLSIDAENHNRVVIGSTPWSRQAKKLKAKVENFLEGS